jgi:hypothetical protein
MITPDQLAKSGTEHGHQTALFAYVAFAHLHGFDIADEWAKTGVMPCNSPYAMYETPTVPALAWFHAIPNGGSRGDNAKSRAIRGGQMKAEGVRTGVADTFLPWPIAGYHGLYIEMKKPSEKPKKESSKGGLSDEQIAFSYHARAVGYGWCVCYSWREAADMLRGYIEYKG